MRISRNIVICDPKVDFYLYFNWNTSCFTRVGINCARISNLLSVLTILSFYCMITNSILVLVSILIHYRYKS